MNPIILAYFGIVLTMLNIFLLKKLKSFNNLSLDISIPLVGVLLLGWIGNVDQNSKEEFIIGSGIKLYHISLLAFAFLLVWFIITLYRTFKVLAGRSGKGKSYSAEILALAKRENLSYEEALVLFNSTKSQ